MEYTFQVRMPQIVAAFTPMVTIWPVLAVPMSHSHGATRWGILAIGILFTLVGIAAMMIVGLKKYLVVVTESTIAVGKRLFNSHDIRSIRFRKSMVDIMTNRSMKRATVAFQSRDLSHAQRILSEFAHANGIDFRQQ